MADIDIFGDDPVVPEEKKEEEVVEKLETEEAKEIENEKEEENKEMEQENGTEEKMVEDGGVIGKFNYRGVRVIQKSLKNSSELPQPGRCNIVVIKWDFDKETRHID